MGRVVGKNVLESLTTGMYSINKIVYREYIQNSADAIDRAVRDGILNKDDNRIDIKINSNRREIRIRDNGTGIQTDKVYNTLGDIGKSQKDFKTEKGFRGIGRLGGLGYCEELQFITSYSGESVKTITSWDCKKLKELLQPNKAKDMDVINVVNAVTQQRTEDENKDDHYFEVVLIGIDEENENLLNIAEIKDYLSQVSPVPFNFQRFSQLTKVKDKLKELNRPADEYNIFLNNEQIYKPYRNRVLAGQKEKDFIKEIEFFQGYKDNGELFFLGWYSITDLSGAIKENDINGIRVRKHNILIGDNHSLDAFFGNNPTYQRFNRWFVGEIYVFDENLIPNARRDDFEKNSTYSAFKEEVEKTTYQKLRILPHSHSQERSERKVITSSESEIEKIKKELDNGLTTTSKERILGKIDSLEKKVKTVTGKVANTNSEENTDIKRKIKILEKKEKIIEGIENLITKVIKSNHYKTDRIPASYPKNVRKVIQRIFEVIDRTLPEGQAQELQDRILEDLKTKA